MSVHYREDDYLDKLIKANFPTALMNSSKWVRLITTLVNNSSEIKECRVKPIWDDEAPIRRLLIQEDVQFGFNFYENAMESMVSGAPTGWYAYKEIEWLDFPKLITSFDQKMKHITQEQNLNLIKSRIEESGQFHLLLTSNNLRLYAYLRIH